MENIWYEFGVLGTMERKVRLSFRHIPSKVSARAIPSRWQDRAETASSPFFTSSDIKKKYVPGMWMWIKGDNRTTSSSRMV
jgi:hypothetical protein